MRNIYSKPKKDSLRYPDLLSLFMVKLNFIIHYTYVFKFKNLLHSGSGQCIALSLSHAPYDDK